MSDFVSSEFIEMQECYLAMVQYVAKLERYVPRCPMCLGMVDVTSGSAMQYDREWVCSSECHTKLADKSNGFPLEIA